MRARFGSPSGRTSRAAALAVAALGVLCASASVPAHATPFTNHFTPYEAALRVRLELLTPDGPPTLMREYRAVAYSLAQIARPSRSLLDDAHLAGRLQRRSGGLLASAEADLDAAILSLAADVAREADLVEAEAGDVVTQPHRSRIADLVARARAALAILAEPGRGGPDASRLVDALRSVGLARRAMDASRACPRLRSANGSARLTALFDGVVFAPAGGGAVRTVFGTEEDAASLLVAAGTPARVGGAVSIEWPSGAFGGPGDYEIGEATGISLRHSLGVLTRFAASGRVTVAGYDAAARTVDGVFDAVLEDGTVITKGRFRVCGFRTARPAVIGPAADR